VSGRLIRVPKVFLEDHVERFDGVFRLVYPVKSTKRHHFLTTEQGPELRLLIWDAEYFDDFWLHDGMDNNGLILSARHTHKAIKRGLGLDENRRWYWYPGAFGASEGPKGSPPVDWEYLEGGFK
jgi:hypothetical protein